MLSKEQLFLLLSNWDESCHLGQKYPSNFIQLEDLSTCSEETGTDPILSQLNPVHLFQHISLKIHFLIILLPLAFPIKLFPTFLIFSMPSTYISQPIYVFNAAISVSDYIIASSGRIFNEWVNSKECQRKNAQLASRYYSGFLL
jgi:hypothetical protein